MVTVGLLTVRITGSNPVAAKDIKLHRESIGDVFFVCDGECVWCVCDGECV